MDHDTVFLFFRIGNAVDEIPNACGVFLRFYFSKVPSIDLLNQNVMSLLRACFCNGTDLTIDRNKHYDTTTEMIET